MDEPDVDCCRQTWQSTYLNIIGKYIPKRSLPAEGTFLGSTPLSVELSSEETPYLRPTNARAVVLNYSSTSSSENQIVSEVRKAKLQFF